MRFGAGIWRGKASYSALAYLWLFGLAVAIPLVLLLAAFLVRSASDEREQLEQRILQVLDGLIANIDRDLDRHLTILRTLATSPFLRNEDWPAFYEQAKVGLQGRAYLVLTDSNGRQLVNTYVPYGQQPALTGDPETVGRMSETKGPVISNLFTSLVVKKPVFNVSIPVLADGRLRFVMSLGLLPDDLTALLSGQELGTEWVATIWDANGAILARSRDNARYVGVILPARLREQGQHTVVRTSNLDGVDVLQATGRSRLSGWSVGVNFPNALANEPLQRTMLLWSAAVIAALALALGLGLLFARQIAQALSLASDAAVAFGHGQPVTIGHSRLEEADVLLETLRSAQRELSDRTAELKRAEQRFRAVVDGAPNAMILADRDGQIVLVNEQTEKLFGYARTELIGQKIEMLVPEQFRSHHPTDRSNYLTHPAMRLMGTGRNVFARRKDGTVVAVEIGLSPIVTSVGNMVLSAIVDITERQKVEEAQQLVIRELNHRTQNLLTVVQAVVSRSMEEAKTFAEAKLVISGRVKALSQAYAMLALAKWEGASLQRIIEQQQFGGLLNRVTITGCNIFVVPSAAQQFAMILHELTTNALKYGSLSTAEGRISIEGSIERDGDGGVFSFVWKEIGGPSVSPPGRKGFGTVILVDSAKHFADDVSIDYSPFGLSYGLKVRLAAIEAALPFAASA